MEAAWKQPSQRQSKSTAAAKGEAMCALALALALALAVNCSGASSMEKAGREAATYPVCDGTRAAPVQAAG